MRQIILFIFIVGECNSNSYSNNLILNKQENINKTALILGEKIAQLLRFYDNYNRLFYIDRESMELYETTRQFFVFNKKKNPLFMYNFDKMSKLFPRPPIANGVHVIFSNNLTLWDFFNVNKYINYRDVVILVALNVNLRANLLKRQKNMIRLAGKTLLLEVKSFDVQLYKICFYCGIQQNTFHQIPMIKNEIFLDDYKDLNGHKLNIVFMPNYPFAYCNNSQIINGNKICEQINGIESHMIKLISKKMNFTFTLYELNFDKSSYLKMLTNMKKHDTDIAFGAISMTLNRRNVIEFTTQYHTENFNLLYKTSMDFVDVLEKFFDPLSTPILWLLFFVAFVLIALILYFMQKLRTVEEISLRDCFWVLLQIQLEQAVAGNSFKTSSKRNPCWAAMLLLWCGCCMVLCAAYKGATLSSLVRPSRTEPETLSELVTSGYRIVASNKSFDIVQDSLNISDPMYRQTLTRMEFGSTICEVFSEVLEEYPRTALLNEWSMIQFQIRSECPEPSNKLLKRIRIARYPVMSAGHAWATRIGAPYKQAIDYYLGLILSGGLFNKWRRDHTLQRTGKRAEEFRISRENRGDEMQTMALNLSTFYPLFIIYFFGIGCALISFVYELVRFNYKLIRRYFLYDSTIS